MTRLHWQKQALFLTALMAASGCRGLEWMGGITHARLEDASVQPYLLAAGRSMRAELGFTELPVQGPVRVEVPRSKTYYDVMLHIERGNVSRTVNFLLRDGHPVWSGEQEIHFSGRQFETVDGRVGENLVVSYSTVAGSGTQKGGYVTYFGPDQQLEQRSIQGQLSVADARRIWDTWLK
jgi:hypothetical protein